MIYTIYTIIMKFRIYKTKMRKLMLREQELKNEQLHRQNSLLTADYIEYRKNKIIKDIKNDDIPEK